ncbi:MAG: hypothetical protein CMA00_004450 [Methanobacteriota archaeon]|jgi:acetyl/propionyl-CoA carboxylase alpha subunit|nr:MAG: hypothetical protein CMA00_004450 [Euryarchaeota archaeon]|tara:strand:- start:2279 stop:2779 length:501 start_codon:yes stop_codon:yes gene_type:complete
MEWSVSDETSRYRPTIQEAEGTVSVTSVTVDGSEASLPEVSVAPDSQPGRVVVDIGGSRRIAHVARTGDSWWVHVDGRAHELKFHEKGSREGSSGEGSLNAPMPGTVLEVAVKEGQRVREGQHLMTLEAMKMEHRILATKPGEVSKVHFSKGDRVGMGDALVEMGD